MFKELGQLASLFKNLPKIKEEMAKLQQRMGQITAEGSAGGGMVTARANGLMEIVSCTVSDDLLRRNDREMLEDLVKAAVNQALQKVRQAVAEESSQIALSLGLPPGMGFPGLG